MTSSLKLKRVCAALTFTASTQINIKVHIGAVETTSSGEGELVYVNSYITKRYKYIMITRSLSNYVLLIVKW